MGAVCPNEGLTLEMSAICTKPHRQNETAHSHMMSLKKKHTIPDIKYQPMLIEPIFSLLVKAERNIFQN